MPTQSPNQSAYNSVGKHFPNSLQPVDHRGQGRPGDAEAHVHPPGQPDDGGAVDAEGRLLPQAQAHQQHLRQARAGEFDKLP